MSATGYEMSGWMEDQLKMLKEQQEIEKNRQQRIDSAQRAAAMAQKMHPETMAGVLVGQLLGDAVGRWLNRDGGSWDGATPKIEAGAEGSAGDIISNQILDERNTAMSDQLMKDMLPEQYNARENEKMEAFINTDPSSVSVLDGGQFSWEKEKGGPYSFESYKYLPRQRRLLW